MFVWSICSLESVRDNRGIVVFCPTPCRSAPDRREMQPASNVTLFSAQSVGQEGLVANSQATALNAEKRPHFRAFFGEKGPRRGAERWRQVPAVRHGHSPTRDPGQKVHQATTQVELATRRAGSAESQRSNIIDQRLPNGHRTLATSLYCPARPQPKRKLKKMRPTRSPT